MSANESLKITTGEVPFDVPAAGKPCKTWYKVFGDLSAGKRPLVTLHGGPGVNSEYLESLSDITVTHSIPVIVYDQIGNGLSTHLQEKMGDEQFWSVQLFIDELNNLLKHLGIADDFDLLGHSWGGIFAASFAITQPKGLKHLIIASGPADMPATVKSQEKLRSQLPQDVQDTLTKHEEAGTTESDEYHVASDVFNSRYVCRMNPMPQELANGFGWIAKDPTVYMTMCAHYPFQSVQMGAHDFFLFHSLQERALRVQDPRITQELVGPRRNTQNQCANASDERTLR